jgi:hypothetical protein
MDGQNAVSGEIGDGDVKVATPRVQIDEHP